MNFQTPVLPNGPNFGAGGPLGTTGEGEGDDRKRKLEEEGKDAGGEKRVKT